jgi:hypothetical protein
VLVGLTKLAGVVVFWVVSGPGIAALAVGYLGLLRLFRTVTARASAGTEGAAAGGGHRPARADGG